MLWSVKGEKAEVEKLLHGTDLGAKELHQQTLVWAGIWSQAKVAFVGNTCWWIERGFLVLRRDEVVNP